MIEQILQYQFLNNAIIASVLTAIACGIIGTYIVSKRIVFIAGGITHASFGGIGIGFFLGINPIFSALVFAVLVALGIQYFSKSTNLREDSVIATLWAFGHGSGNFVCVYYSRLYAQFNELSFRKYPYSF